jgi:hypothetical protein
MARQQQFTEEAGTIPWCRVDELTFKREIPGASCLVTKVAGGFKINWWTQCLPLGSEENARNYAGRVLDAIVNKAPVPDIEAVPAPMSDVEYQRQKNRWYAALMRGSIDKDQYATAIADLNQERGFVAETRQPATPSTATTYESKPMSDQSSMSPLMKAAQEVEHADLKYKEFLLDLRSEAGA